MIDGGPLARKLGAYVALSYAELSVLGTMHRRRLVFPVGKDMVHEGQANQVAYILAKGWACSYKILPDGNRQIVDIQIPGDFLGLRSVLFRTADHNIVPITKVEASEVAVSDLLNTFSTSPRLATAILWAASRDEAMVVEHLVGLGRRSALQRTAHFLLEMGARLKLVGLGTNEGYYCPLSQFMLADALGLTAVHINRVLRTLREDGVMTLNNKQVRFLNLERLTEIGEFDLEYLDQSGPLLR